MQPTNYTFASREATSAPSGSGPRRRRRRTSPDTRPIDQGSSPSTAPAPRQPERRPARDDDDRAGRFGRDERPGLASDLPPSLFRSSNGPRTSTNGASAPARPAAPASAPVRQHDRPAPRPNLDVR